MSYFEDIKIGDRCSLRSFRFTVENIKEFARKFNPQTFHLDEEAAQEVFGGLAASGWHVAAAWNKLMVAKFDREAAVRAAQGKAPVLAGPSPGFRDLKWIKPVFAGDTIFYDWEVTSTRASQRRPEWGLVHSHNTGGNQLGELVFSFDATAFMPRRSHE